MISLVTAVNDQCVVLSIYSAVNLQHFFPYIMDEILNFHIF